MNNQLIDVSIKTMIGMLPEIINSNNKTIKDEFDSLIDSSGNIIKNVYIPDNGVVNSYTGQFINTTTDILTVNDTSSCQNIIKKVEHNNLKLRHYNVEGDEIKEVDSINDLYAHNTGSIIHYGKNEVKSLYDIINELYTFVGSKPISYVNMPTVYGVNQNINIGSDNSYTLDNSVLFANKAQLMKLKLKPWQYIDIANGILYTYYDYNNIVTITDEYPASIDGLEGVTISIKFDDMKKKGFYKILLSRKDNKFLRISKDELVRLNLICINQDETYGTEWDVDSYSVRNPEDISIVKK